MVRFGNGRRTEDPRPWAEGVRRRDDVRAPKFEPGQINEGAFSYYARLDRVRRYVEGHYGEELSLGKLASVAGLERRYFSTFFHQKTGVRLTDWIAHVRISKATRMIRSHNYPISQVAHSVGYGDLRCFERAFKRYRNQTPSEYKRAVRPS